MKKFALRALRALAVAAFWFAVWILLSFSINSDFLFPAPWTVLQEFFRLIVTGNFWLTTSFSLFRVLSGILISLVLGTLLAYFTHISKILNAILSPALSAVKATPVASFIILALLWLNRGILPIFITSLIVIPIVWANVSEGIKRVDPLLIDVAKIYRFSVAKKIFRLYVPSIAPYFTAACRSSLGMAWKAGIAAEILATPQNAIGRELYFSKTYLETPTLFAWTIVVILLSCILEKLFELLFKHIGARYHLIPKGDTNAEN